jgi:hypothetical protein
VKNSKLSRVIVVAVLALSIVSQIGCGKGEEAKPPDNSTYYKGPLAAKPQGSMTPRGREGTGTEK